ncbi:MAG: SH3 domain-containing protein [Phototrophicaceae bacterium]|jgi:uncharacterized protein YgiM (DUF1202 family)
MNRRLWITFVALWMLAVGALTYAQGVNATATVITDLLNVRQAPLSDSAIVTRLTLGYTAAAIGRTADASWYQVSVPGGSGWVNAQYVVVTNANLVPQTWSGVSSPVVTAAPVIAPAVLVGTVNTGGLNVRSVPAFDNNVPLRVIYRNASVNITGRTSDSQWALIQLSDGLTGWVRARYLNLPANTSLANVPVIVASGTAPTPAPTTVYANGYVNTGALNIRPVPSPTGNIPLTFVYRNTPVEVVGRTANSEWLQVRVSSGVVGWVRSRYLAITSGNFANAPITG